VPRAVADYRELLRERAIDAAHVLVPPALHGEIAAACLDAGVHTLVEKPLVPRAEQVAALAARAAERGVLLATNHNQTFHPALVRLQSHLAAGRLGKLEHVAIQHHVPLRQLQTGDVGHFMFQTQANILWEQGVHLFSMVFLLLGACRSVKAITGTPRRLPNGVEFRHVYGAAILCGIGFTMSLFIGMLAFENGATGEVIVTDRLGILVGTLLSAVVGYLVLHVVLPKQPTPHA